MDAYGDSLTCLIRRKSLRSRSAPVVHRTICTVDKRKHLSMRPSPVDAWTWTRTHAPDSATGIARMRVNVSHLPWPCRRVCQWWCNTAVRGSVSHRATPVGRPCHARPCHLIDGADARNATPQTRGCCAAGADHRSSAPKWHGSRRGRVGTAARWAPQLWSSFQNKVQALQPVMLHRTLMRLAGLAGCRAVR